MMSDPARRFPGENELRTLTEEAPHGREPWTQATVLARQEQESHHLPELSGICDTGPQLVHLVPHLLSDFLETRCVQIQDFDRARDSFRRHTDSPTGAGIGNDGPVRLHEHQRGLIRNSPWIQQIRAPMRSLGLVTGPIDVTVAAVTGMAGASLAARQRVLRAEFELRTPEGITPRNEVLDQSVRWSEVDFAVPAQPVLELRQRLDQFDPRGPLFELPKLAPTRARALLRPVAAQARWRCLQRPDSLQAGSAISRRILRLSCARSAL